MIAEKDINPAQLRCVNTMISKLGLKDIRADLISGATGERSDSASDLKMHEAAQLIKYLKSQDPEELRAEKMRRKLIGMAYERAGLARDAPKEQKQKTVNWLNGWCKQYGYLHKALNCYRYNELPMLISQFENVLKDHLISL